MFICLGICIWVCFLGVFGVFFFKGQNFHNLELQIFLQDKKKSIDYKRSSALLPLTQERKKKSKPSLELIS